MTTIKNKIVTITEVPVTVNDRDSVIQIKHDRNPAKATFSITVKFTTIHFNPLSEVETEAVLVRVWQELREVVSQAIEARGDDLMAITKLDPSQLTMAFREEFGTEHVEPDVKDEDEDEDEVLVGNKERVKNRPKGRAKRG